MLSPVLPAKQSERLAAVIKEHVQIPRDPPNVVLIVGPCRVGTTALSNLFARQGIPAYMQPLKSMRRAVEAGEAITDWAIDDGEDFVVSKETLGPKTAAEFFDPVTELTKIGYPPDKIQVIGICREPRSTLASWVSMWGRIPINGFIKSFQLINQIMVNAKQGGVKTTYYVQEAIAANEPQTVVEKLFTRVGIKTNPQKSRGLTDWKSGAVFGETGSNVVFFDSPPPRFIKGVKEEGGYRFRLLVTQLTEEQEKVLRKNKVYDLYEKFVRECEKDLQIQILEKR
jgi:hypothetical protein